MPAPPVITPYVGEQLEIVNTKEFAGELDLFPGLPGGVFQSLLIDPPWNYSLRPNDASHRNRIDYSSLSLAQLKELPVNRLADPAGCVLWLWFTNNHISEAIELINHWGFTHKTIVTWVKTTNDGSRPRIGAGHWLRSCTEHIAIATLGKQSSFRHLGTLTNQPNVIMAPRRQHSRKPEESYRLIESMQPDAARLELFARCKRPGWEVWGNELDKFEQG